VAKGFRGEGWGFEVRFREPNSVRKEHHGRDASVVCCWLREGERDDEQKYIL
jgi:hypothetical protein